MLNKFELSFSFIHDEITHKSLLKRTIKCIIGLHISTLSLSHHYQMFNREIWGSVGILN